MEEVALVGQQGLEQELREEQVEAVRAIVSKQKPVYSTPNLD